MTNEQKQCLLRYLGYYDDDVDGVWGTNSKNATKKFQSDNGLKSDGIFGNATKSKILEHVANGTGFKKTTTTTKTANSWSDIKHFKKEEFACKCGGKYCKGYPVEPQLKLIRVADTIREKAGREAVVTSGIRCQKHNANVGGVSNSRHLSGKAMDFRIEGWTSTKLLAEVKKHSEIRYAYAIDGQHVHMDIP